MRRDSMSVVIALVLVLIFPKMQFGQQAGNNAAGRQFDPHDLSGVWSISGGDRGINREKATDVPEMTPEGQRIFNGNKPSRGRYLGEPLDGDHLGRVRATQVPALTNDPIANCIPQGPTRLILDGEPMEFIQLNGRLLQFFQWGHVIREIWSDGRELPSGENLANLGPSFFGMSVGKWEGNTLVVNTVGLNDRTWLDIFGFPHSSDMRLEERYTRVSADSVELTMTIYDPKIYKTPFVSDKKIFKPTPKGDISYFGWYGFSGMLEGICVAVDEMEYNRRVRDPAGLGKK